MTKPFTPAEAGVFNILSAAPAGKQLAEWEIQSQYADKHGGYKGVSEALNSLSAAGHIECERKPVNATSNRTEAWYALPVKQAATPAIQGSGTGQGSNADYSKQETHLHNVGYII